MSAHMPAPWRSGYPDYFDVASGGRRVCSLPHAESPEHKGNASLIIAAPLLLAAAKAGLERIESDIESPRLKSPEGDFLRTAISQAESRP